MRRKKKRGRVRRRRRRSRKKRSRRRRRRRKRRRRRIQSFDTVDGTESYLGLNIKLSFLNLIKQRISTTGEQFFL